MEKYHTSWALCLEQLSSRTLISSYSQVTVWFSCLCYPGIKLFAEWNQVNFTQQYVKNLQRCRQNPFFYAVWELLLSLAFWMKKLCCVEKKMSYQCQRGGGQNLERPNVEDRDFGISKFGTTEYRRPIFRNFKISNIKKTKDF